MKITNPFLHTDNSEKLKKSGSPEDAEKLLDACKEFEAIFLEMMLKQMRRTVPEGELIEKSFAREIYETMQDEEISKEMARGRGIGLAQDLYKQLSRK